LSRVGSPTFFIIYFTSSRRQVAYLKNRYKAVHVFFEVDAGFVAVDDWRVASTVKFRL